MEEGAKIGREHEQQQQQHGRVNGSGRVAAVGGGSGGGGDEIEIEVAAAAGASPSRQHGGLHGDVQVSLFFFLSSSSARLPAVNFFFSPAVRTSRKQTMCSTITSANSDI